MEAYLERLIEWFALPQHGLTSVFFVSFLSATLLPVGSEPAVFGYVKLNPDAFWLTVAVATAGNTLGGMVDYAVGRGAKYAIGKHAGTRYFGWLERFGPKVLLLSWMPAVGDPLCALAGWLRLPFWPCVLFMAIGKALRYVTMTAMLLWVPDDWWRRMLLMVTG
ncbi:MAG TPA: YqaA family protein [Burkholderiaceae bacterium]|nr:YqaA family protein [Burkholderiaceae bacterium]